MERSLTTTSVDLKEILNLKSNKKYLFLSSTNIVGGGQSQQTATNNEDECDCNLIELSKFKDARILNESLLLLSDKLHVGSSSSTDTRILDGLKLNGGNSFNDASLGKSFDFENIKRCPKCSILIERADGCAQIMCKACRHTFCFYCLTSLDVRSYTLYLLIFVFNFLNFNFKRTTFC